MGLVVGALAKWMMPKRDPGSIVSTIVLGIGGAFLVGILGAGLGWYDEGRAVGFLASLAGAVIVLMLYRRQIA